MRPQGDPPDPTTVLARVRPWTRWMAARWGGAEATAPEGAPPYAALETARLADLLALLRPGDPEAQHGTKQTLVENTVALAGLREAGHALDARGVTWCAIKGAALVVREPRLLRVRRMSDVDVLVASWSLQAAADALRGVGGVVAAHHGDAVASRSVALRHRGGLLHVDLHGGMAVGRQFAELGAALLRSRRQMGGICVASDELLMLATVWHRARGSWSGDLREVFDLWLLCAQAGVGAHCNEGNTSVEANDGDAVAEAVAGLAMEHGLGPHLLLSLREAAIWFGPCPVGDRIGRELERRLPTRLVGRVDVLAGVLERYGALPWARVPIAGRYGTLASLAGAPARVLVDGGEYAGRRLAVVLRRRGEAGGRLGRLFRRRA